MTDPLLYSISFIAACGWGLMILWWRMSNKWRALAKDAVALLEEKAKAP